MKKYEQMVIEMRKILDRTNVPYNEHMVGRGRTIMRISFQFKGYSIIIKEPDLCHMEMFSENYDYSHSDVAKFELESKLKLLIKERGK